MGEHCKGTQLVRNNKLAIWKNKNTKTGKLYVALFNLSDEDMEIGVAVDELDEDMAATKEFSGYDIWDKTEEKFSEGKISAVVKKHGVKAFYIE